MEMVVIGEAIAIGNNINTDQIYPGRFLVFTDPEEIGGRCLSGVDENVAVSFPKGGIVVAGTDFGCESSREHAPTALLRMGASVVVVDSFVRTFSRNSINLGLPLVVCRGIGKRVKCRQTLKLDLENGTVTAMEIGECWLREKMREQVFKTLEVGGVKLMMGERMKKGGE